MDPNNTYVPTPERPMEAYLAQARRGVPVYRYNNVWGYWEELWPDGSWVELDHLDGEDWERGDVYHDDSAAYCDPDAPAPDDEG